MRIGEIAARAGVSTDTVRFYEARGLIRSVRRANGYRDFDVTAIEVIGLVRLAREMGFTLAEVGELLDGMTDGGLSSEQIRALMEAKIAELDVRMAGLSRLRSVLVQRLQEACPLMPRPLA